jgi:hypothetical protein
VTAASRDRNDAIFLVGRGWAQDDPVRDYVVMHTTTQGDSPFAVHRHGEVAAVDIEPRGGDLDVPNGGLSYRPQHDPTD